MVAVRDLYQDEIVDDVLIQTGGKTLRRSGEYW